MKIQIKTYKTIETTKTIEVNSFNEFYASCYDNCNCQMYVGGFVKNKKIVWIEITVGSNYSPNIKIDNVCNGGRDDLEFDIKRILERNTNIQQISKDKFFDLLKDVKELLL